MSSDNGFKVNDMLMDVEENSMQMWRRCLFSAIVDQDWEK